MGRGMMDISETDVARNGRIHAQIFMVAMFFAPAELQNMLVGAGKATKKK